MTAQAWKAWERRAATALGGRRAGPLGAAVSDAVGVPFALECKRTKRPPCARWIAQARAQGKREGKPWLLAISGHNDPRPLAIVEFKVLVELAERAGLLEPDAAPLDGRRQGALFP